MTETFYPFKEPPGNVLEETTWAEIFRYIINTGVMTVKFSDAVNELKVTAGGASREVLVDSGTAFVMGHYYRNSTSLALNCSVNADPTGTRADLVVLECKWGVDASITAKLVEGTPGQVWPEGSGILTGTPKPALLTQTYGTLWQVALAQVNVAYQAVTIQTADITDMRGFASAGNAKSDTCVIAADTASPFERANADAVIPTGSLHAETAINAGIAYVSNTYGGGSVKLNGPILLTSGSIIGASGVHLKGNGNGTQIKYQIAGGAYPVISLSSCVNASISDLYIDAGGSALTAGSLPAAISGANAIEIDEGANNWIRNCYIKSARNHGVFVNTTVAPTTSFGNRITGCYITGCYAAGVYSTGSYGRISQNEFDGNVYGIALSGTTTSLGATANAVGSNIIKNQFKNGINLVSDTGAWVQRNDVKNNLVISSGKDSDNVYIQVYLYGALTEYNTLQSNTVYSTATPYCIAGISLNTTVSNNNVMNNQCIGAAKLAANNIVCNRASGTNSTPNWIRYNHSGSVAPSSPTSYDA